MQIDAKLINYASYLAVSIILKPSDLRSVKKI